MKTRKRESTIIHCFISFHKQANSSKSARENEETAKLEQLAANASSMIADPVFFFKVFKRVSWWSFRVSTPFYLLSLILITHFHKNAGFRAGRLDSGFFDPKNVLLNFVDISLDNFF